MKIELSKNKILVTGSTGFIGGRLVEKLILNHNKKVTTVIRKYDNAARIARFSDIEMVKSNLDDDKMMSLLIKNTDYVFHLAYDFASQQANLSSLDIIAKNCIKHSKRLVHISTISVFEPLLDSTLNEKSASVPCGLVYADRKLEIENKVFEYSNAGLDVVILQPTIVYGPYCNPWTLNPAEQLVSGTVVLPNNGNGVCNAVYVDDVCDAIILAADSQKARGERFLISGNDYISWKHFFNTFEKILGVCSLKLMSSNEISKYNRNPLRFIKSILSQPKKAISWEPLKSILLLLKDKLSSNIKAFIMDLYSSYSTIKPKSIFIPDKQLNLLYSSETKVDISKAKNILGYEPKFTFSEGMDLTGKFIKSIYSSNPSSNS